MRAEWQPRPGEKGVVDEITGGWAHPQKGPHSLDSQKEVLAGVKYSIFSSYSDEEKRAAQYLEDVTLEHLPGLDRICVTPNFKNGVHLNFILPSAADRSEEAVKTPGMVSLLKALNVDPAQVACQSRRDIEGAYDVSVTLPLSLDQLLKAATKEKYGSRSDIPRG